MATKKKMLQAAAGVGGVPEGAWDLSYAYYDDPFAWDISTAVYASKSFSVGAQESVPEGVFFKPDGLKMYVVGSTGDDVNEYSLSTAWDILSASYIQSFSVSAQDTLPTDVFFKPDGAKMYVVGDAGNDINEYNLSTSWDISSASYLQSFSVNAQEGNPKGVFFKPDGAKMYVVGLGADAVAEYDLSTAWDISTSSYLQNFSVATQDVEPQAVFFKSDGTKMYVVGENTINVFEYTLSTAWDVSTASYIQSFSVFAQEVQPKGIFFKPDGSSFFVVGRDSDTVYQYTLGGFSVAAREASPQGLSFKADGTKMYVIGLAGDDVNEYNLSTAWDTSTAAYAGRFVVSSQDSNPEGMFFKPDGTKMYVVGRTNRSVYEYSLSTAWSVSTASYIASFSVISQDTDPVGVSFSSDGIKMYVIGYSSDAVNEYSLSTAWDISTASYVQNFSVLAQGSSPEDLFFKPDGTKFYVIDRGSDYVSEYALSTDWNIATSSYVQNFYIGIQATNGTGIFFKDDGTQMFVIGDSKDKVFTYSLGVQE
mgnify:CR=1 FL=1